MAERLSLQSRRLLDGRSCGSFIMSLISPGPISGSNGTATALPSGCLETGFRIKILVGLWVGDAKLGFARCASL